MSYTLDELYNAISATERVVGKFQMINEREYGSGAIFFLSDDSLRIHQVYASPMWDQADEGFDFVVDKDIDTNIALQTFSFKDGDDNPPDLHIHLTGDITQDIETYFEVMESYLKLLNKPK